MSSAKASGVPVRPARAGTVAWADCRAAAGPYDFKLIKKWGGPTKDAANLSNAHCISIDATDPRGPLVWVASRSQSQIKAFMLDGTYADIIDLSGTFVGQFISRDDKIRRRRSTRGRRVRTGG
jgi:hypothetical protein